MGGGVSANRRYIDKDGSGTEPSSPMAGQAQSSTADCVGSLRSTPVTRTTTISMCGQQSDWSGAVGQRGPLGGTWSGLDTGRALGCRLDSTSHVAIIGAGSVGANCAFALLSKGTAGKVTLTDIDAKKCEGEVLDLEDGGGKIEVATMQEAGRADIIVITAGRPQKEGETRIDLVKANAGIMRDIIDKMKPIKDTAKVIVVSNPCDALTYVAQECAGLPEGQVFGSGTVLDSWRLRVALSKKVRVHHSSITLYVLGEHGDSQFPVPSLANIGGVPFTKASLPVPIDLEQMSRDSASKAYDIISKKGHTAYGVAQAVETIVDAILNNKKRVLPVSIRVPGRACCLSLPSVVGIHGVERVLDNVVEHFDEKEMSMYNNSIARMEEAIASLQPIEDWDPIPPNTPYTP